MTPLARRSFGTLDGLRGAAAVAVAFRHIPDNAVATWTPHSYLAVDLFFVLSGFVVDHAYAARLMAGMRLRDFALIRLIRLYPLYLAASLITLALVLVPARSGHYHPPLPSWRTLALGALFVPTIAPGEKIGLYPLVGPAWSLFFELAVNFAFALVVPFLTRRRVALLTAVGAAGLVATAVHFGKIDVGWAQDNLWGGFGRVSYTFFAGVAAHRLWASGRLPWLCLPALAAAGVTLAIFIIDPRNPTIGDTLLILFAMPALVLAAARAEPPARLARPFALAGAASYAVYLLTNPVDQFIETLLPWRDVNDFAGLGTAGAVLMVIGIVALSLWLDRVYDIPLRRRLTRWAGVGRDYHSAAERLR